MSEKNSTPPPSPAGGALPSPKPPLSPPSSPFLSKRVRGRPLLGICKNKADRDGVRRDDRRWKTFHQSTFASCVRTSCAFYGIEPTKIAESMAERGFRMSGPSPLASKLVPPPFDADAVAIAAWLAENVYIVGHGGTLQTNTKPLVLTANSVGFPWRTDPARKIYGFRQLELWTKLWADSRLAVELLPGVGLGLVARQPIADKTVIVGGVVDYDLTDYKSLTLMSCQGRVGALLGPVSLANSMCERHANAVLKQRAKGAEMLLQAKRRIRAGSQICFTYEQIGADPERDTPLPCAACARTHKKKKTETLSYSL